MKIIGNTVGTTMPRPDLRQTDPEKGNYVYGSSDIVKTVNGIFPDENGNIDVEGFSSGSNIYIQDDEPVDVTDNAIWIDTDDNTGNGGDEPSGGNTNVGVQPDLAQNDETAPDYVKGRAFYTEAEQDIIICDAIVNTEDGCGYIVPWPELEAEFAYKVVFNGVEYEAVFNGETLGNENLWGGYIGYELQDGELPFCVDYSGELGTNVDGDFTVKITCVMPVVHTIDAKYLPDHYIPIIDMKKLVPGYFNDNKNSTMTYKQTPESFSEIMKLIKLIDEGKAVPYMIGNGPHDCRLIGANYKNNSFSFSYVTYDGGGNGLVNGAYTMSRRTNQHNIDVEYNVNTNMVTLEHELWRTDIPYSNAMIDTKIAEATVTDEHINELIGIANEEYATADSPIFTSSINMGRKESSEVGYDSVAIGRECVSSLDYCVAIGDTASATNYSAIAIGTDVVAGGMYSYAGGYETDSLGYVSYTEGAYTKATGDYSHAEGCGTIANVTAQHVQGKYNLRDEDSKYLHIVGNGESDSSRSNAHTIDKEGNGWFAGSLEGNALIIKSSTEGSNKRFKITVNDSGALTATEVI